MRSRAVREHLAQLGVLAVLGEQLARRRRRRPSARRHSSASLAAGSSGGTRGRPRRSALRSPITSGSDICLRRSAKRDSICSTSLSIIRV